MKQPNLLPTNAHID